MQMARVSMTSAAPPWPAAHGMAQPAAGAQGLDEGAAFGIDVGAVVVRHVLRGPGFELAGQRAVAVVEEGPVEVAATRATASRDGTRIFAP
jgi:hypothetical protein